MDVNATNSFNPPPEFLSPQTSSDSGGPAGKTPAQGQEKGGPVVSTGGGTGAYASFQGAQGQGGISGQNINAALGQALGATQDLTTDSSSSEVIDNAQDGTTGDSPIADIGLSADQQVTAQGGAKGQKDSGTGSGGQSEKGEVYIPSAAAGLQKGQTSIQSASSITPSKDISSFTLKVDPTSTTSTSGTSSTDSPTYVDSNGAPAVATPADPNVFDMVEESTSLGSQLQEYQISQMVSSSSAQNQIMAQDYKSQISDIGKYIAAKNSSASKSKMAQTFSWIVNIAMLVVGVLTADPMLIAAGIAGCIMTADPKIISGLSSALEKMFPGLPPAVANIMATLIIVAAVSIGTCGAGAVTTGVLDGASDAVTAGTEAGAEAGAEAADAGADAGAETAATTAAKAAKVPRNWTEMGNSLFTSEGRSALMKGAMKGAEKTITEAPGKMASSIAKTPEAMANSARSLYQFSSRMAEQCMSLGSKGLFEAGEEGAEAGAAAGTTASESASMSEKAIAQLKSVANNIAKNPIKAVHIVADLTMSALSVTGAIEQYNATVLKAKAEEDQGSVLSSQATTTAITALINLSNTQIQDVLSDMNSDIVGAGQVLAAMSKLSSETTGQLHGAA